MPLRVVQHHTREESPTSDSERSFVSAASENTSSWSKKDPPVGQSVAPALPSPPTHSEIVPAKVTSLITSKAANNNLDFSATSQNYPSASPTAPTLLVPPTGSYFSLQPGTPDSEARSPQNRRPPASRSSHGVETSSGPPPALSSRRSYNADITWPSPPSDPRATRPPMVHSASVDSIVKHIHHIANESSDSGASEGVPSAQPRDASIAGGKAVAMNGRYEVYSGSEEDNDPTLRINGDSRRPGKHTREESGQQKSQSSHEDLFLNLARADSVVDDGPEPSNRSEKQPRIRGSSLQQQRESRSSHSHRPSTSGGGFAQEVSPMQYNHYGSSFDPSFHRPPGKSSPFTDRDFSANGRSYAAFAQPLDQRHRTINTRTSIADFTSNGLSRKQLPESRQQNGRRSSIREASSELEGLGYDQSNFSHTLNGNYKSSYFSGHQGQGEEIDEDPRTPHAEDTESTVSTTAPSTVWDELEDMKSRIRKLEISGDLPTSSNAAMTKTFRDRPPTATTTMTNSSLSPKRLHMKSISPGASTVKSPELVNVHPLLHTALAKTKAAISANVYQALEATAADALTLAAMAKSASAQRVSPSIASVAGTSNGVDRPLRRRIDSMCRSLTELCIALAEEAPETEGGVVKTRAGSEDADRAARQTEPVLQDVRSSRATSDEPEFRSSSRVMSRLEARRTSLALGSSPLSRRESPQQASAPTQALPPASSVLDRRSSVIHRGHANEDQVDSTSSGRPRSRAMTEIGQIRSSPQIRPSREYTSQHPMPDHSQRTPSVQSSLPTRKSYFPTASRSPSTPNAQPQNRSYLDRSTPPSSADSSRLAEARQRRIASLGQHGQSRIGVASGRLRQPMVEQQ